MADPMRIRAIEKNGITEVKVLMSHEMETGQRKDGTGKIVPAWFIQTVSFKHKDKEVFSAQFGTSISKNPLLSFRFRGAEKGDKIVVNWVDNHGDKRQDEAAVV
jgi:sulfur-oxidizing protein SoxZ